MAKETVNVLLTCVNSQVSPSLIKLIYGHPDYEIKTIGVDTVPFEDNLGRNFCDLCYQVPKGTDNDYFSAIFEIVRKNDIRVIFPGSDEECLTLASKRNEFRRIDADICCSKLDVVSLAADKFKIMSKLKDKGLRICKVFAPQSIKDIEEMAEKLGYPEFDFVVKPKFGRGSKGFKIVTVEKDFHDLFYDKYNYKSTYKELIEIFSRHVEEIQKYLMMEYFPGDKYSADVLVSDGKVISMVIRNNGSLPKVSPPTQIADIVFDKDIREYAESIVGLLGFDYFVQIEIGRDINGDPRLIEINTRLDATLPITSGLGLNYLHEMITYSVTGRMRDCINDYKNYEKQLRFRRYWQHLFEEH
jgi:carbamoyl-phosphate synthase large subunit